MQLFKFLLLLLASTTFSIAAPGRNLTSLAANRNIPYPSGYSMKTCPAGDNAWGSGQRQNSPKYRPRSFAAPEDGILNTDEQPLVRLSFRQPVNMARSIKSKRQQQSLCKSVARQHFNYNGVESNHATAPILLQAGIQYVVSFASNNPVLGVTVFQAAVGSALSHAVAHPNFAQAARGTLTFTLKQAANVWVLLKFAGGVSAQGDLGIFALNTPSELNLEAGSGGL